MSKGAEIAMVMGTYIPRVSRNDYLHDLDCQIVVFLWLRNYVYNYTGYWIVSEELFGLGNNDAFYLWWNKNRLEFRITVHRSALDRTSDYRLSVGVTLWLYCVTFCVTTMWFRDYHVIFLLYSVTVLCGYCVIVLCDYCVTVLCVTTVWLWLYCVTDCIVWLLCGCTVTVMWLWLTARKAIAVCNYLYK